MFSLAVLSLPVSWLYLIAFGFGVIIGSFLNVCIYRLNTGKSLSGHSHCLSCGTPLRWYDLFPLLSYLFLHGRCRVCGCLITSRYFWVELATGVLFSLTLTLTYDLIEVLIYWFILSYLVIITVYDYYHFIIPDKLTLILTVAVTGLIVYRYFLLKLGWHSVLVDVLSALCGSGFFLFLWTISKGKWLGFGDVKLAFPLSLLVGASLVFSLVVLSFWIGAAISLMIIGIEKLKRGKAHLHLSSSTLTMKSAVPFAPFLVASGIITLFTNLNVLHLFIFL